MDRKLLLLLLLAAATSMVGCRGSVKKKAPIHPNWNMDQTTRFDAQEPNEFYADGRSSRVWPEGTVRGADPRGDAPVCVLSEANPHLCEGKADDGSWATTLPPELTLDAAFIDRGQDRYGIYCTPCHDAVGNGDGMVARRGLKPVSLHLDPIRAREVGKLYDSIKNGGALMPGYATQISVEDRWAIATYVRALQISQSGGN